MLGTEHLRRAPGSTLAKYFRDGRSRNTRDKCTNDNIGQTGSISWLSEVVVFSRLRSKVVYVEAVNII